MITKFQIRPCSEMLDNVWYVVGKFRFHGVDFVGYYSLSDTSIIYCDMEAFTNV